MSITEYTANTVRALMAAEIAMGSVNAGSRFVTRGHAERLLDDYFSLVEQSIQWDDEPWTAGPDALSLIRFADQEAGSLPTPSGDNPASCAASTR